MIDLHNKAEHHVYKIQQFLFPFPKPKQIGISWRMVQCRLAFLGLQMTREFIQTTYTHTTAVFWQSNHTKFATRTKNQWSSNSNRDKPSRNRRVGSISQRRLLLLGLSARSQWISKKLRCWWWSLSISCGKKKLSITFTHTAKQTYTHNHKRKTQRN